MAGFWTYLKDRAKRTCWPAGCGHEKQGRAQPHPQALLLNNRAAGAASASLRATRGKAGRQAGLGRVKC